jgi:glycosyltransferase involved in cell wall biosynthesis
VGRVRVGIDVTPLAQTRAGTARYLSGLLGGLERHPDLELTRLAYTRRGRAAAVVRDTVWYLALLPREARRRGLDVLHCTTFRAPVRARVPLVVTVHDLALLRHPGLFTPWMRLYGRVLLRDVIRRADRVIAVSFFTGREVVELTGAAEERVRVVPNATDAGFTRDGPAAGGDYVFTVSTLEPRKNLPRLVEATRRLGLELRVVGARGWGDVEVGGNGVRWLGELSDAETAELYRGALCVAYPSLYEGFGLPVLEAMRCGAPVVTSAGTAMEEVADGAAELVDPQDASSIAAGIERAIARRDELRALGLARARAFSWERAAEQTAAVYRELAA